jgi:hypothetical protein
VLTNNRVIWKDNSQLIDLSVNLSTYLTGTETIGITAAQDALYIGSDLPFNHRHFEVLTANDQASVVTIDIWDGTTWRAAVDIIDQTAVGGKTLTQSGIISFTPDRFRVWGMQPTTEDISDLSTLKIYNLFWIRIHFSGNLKASTALKYVGFKFSDDLDLAAEYPDLASSNLLSAFKTGKTDWTDQHFIAAEWIVRELRSKNLILSQNQILDWTLYKSASVHKVAEIIFRAFGDDYLEEMKAAQFAYKAAMEIKGVNLDQNANGQLDPLERAPVQEYLSR